MINNYYTLKALVDEIGDEIVSSEVEACYTRVESTLEIILRKENSRPNVIVVSCKPHSNFLYLRAAPRRFNGASVLRAAVGLKVLSVVVVENERSIIFSLSGGKSLHVNLFGPHANVYLVGHSGDLEDAFLRRRKISVQKTLPETRPVWIESLREFVAAFKNGYGTSYQRLVALIPQFTGALAREALHRAGGEGGTGIAGDKNSVLGEDELARLYKAVSEIMDDLESPSPRIYFDGDDPVAMSLIKMQHMGPLSEEIYDSVNMCVSTYSAIAERHRGDAELKRMATVRLAGQKEELTKTILKVEADLKGSREIKYRQSGDAIMAHLDDVKKGTDAFFPGGAIEKIKLDPRLTAVQNAQVYYEKAKKARESYKQALSRRDTLKRSLSEVESELDKILSGMDQKRMTGLVKAEKAREAAKSPFREFETGGYRIFVGKDAKNNDRLTFGFAKPNDVFLHARGVSGSHVIIRNSSREYPQKPVLEFAARLAAHYSKARTSGIVPVAYSMRKFVKKVKGQPGAVLIDREEVIFVTPGIPQGTR